MAEYDVDLLAIDRRSITAPAGCGKTHLIASALARHSGVKPILVLTHTNAGVVALRARLDRLGISPQKYRLSTIDGWAMRLIATFPARSGHQPNLLNLENAATDYPNIRAFAANLIRARHVSDVLQASYVRVIVDEYQDCSKLQHAVITWLATFVPTVVLGDPLQSIFGFGADQLADWQGEVCTFFPAAAELDIPWRWINANNGPLGQWLLQVRAQLLNRQPIDVRTGPPCVTWIAMDGTADHTRRLAAARTQLPGNEGNVLIIGDSVNADSRSQFASQTPGAVTVEAVDLRDLVRFAGDFQLAAPNGCEQLIDFAQRVMRNVGAAEFNRRITSLRNGTARNPPTAAEHAALRFVQAPSYSAAADVLVEIGKQGGVTAHRPAVLKACLKSLQLCAGTPGLPLQEAAVKMREQNRLIGRPLPKRAVGSTLLLKGLEAEVAVILDAEALSARNLYVAMTRGSRSLTICARNPVLSPRVW